MFSQSVIAALPVSYLFIDGECLSCILDKVGERYFGKVRPVLNWLQVAQGHRKTFYYDAIPVQKPAEDDNAHSLRVAPKRSELVAIERQPGFHVRTGEARHRRGRGNEQKMVDVQLAVDALSMASRGLFGSCTLITGDLDFKPLVTALVEMGVDVRLLYPEGETNDDLKAAADRADALTIALLRDWISEDFVQRTSLPTALFTRSFPTMPYSAVLARWHDDRHGDCFVANHDNANTLVLLTEYAPPPQQDWRLQLSGANAEALRAYAEDVFGLPTPKW
jgi:uncharacterized LabA/DUF88 family protein